MMFRRGRILARSNSPWQRGLPRASPTSSAAGVPWRATVSPPIPHRFRRGAPRPASPADSGSTRQHLSLRALTAAAVVLAVIAVGGCQAGRAAHSTSFQTQCVVRFSPKGGCTQLVIDTLGQAKRSVRMQAYSCTSRPIAQALIDAHQTHSHPYE